MEDHPAISKLTTLPKIGTRIVIISNYFLFVCMNIIIFLLKQMASSIIATKGNYFYCYICYFLYIHYFSVINSLYELKLLVDINCCHLKNT